MRLSTVALSVGWPLLAEPQVLDGQEYLSYVPCLRSYASGYAEKPTLKNAL